MSLDMVLNFSHHKEYVYPYQKMQKSQNWPILYIAPFCSEPSICSFAKIKFSLQLNDQF